MLEIKQAPQAKHPNILRQLYGKYNPYLSLMTWYPECQSQEPLQNIPHVPWPWAWTQITHIHSGSYARLLLHFFFKKHQHLKAASLIKHVACLTREFIQYKWSIHVLCSVFTPDLLIQRLICASFFPHRIHFPFPISPPFDQWLSHCCLWSRNSSKGTKGNNLNLFPADLIFEIPLKIHHHEARCLATHEKMRLKEGPDWCFVRVHSLRDCSHC